jgi:SNF2 family DNA or RNA helicase
MTAPPVEIEITYQASTLRGAFHLHETNESAIWERLTQRTLALESDYEFAPGTLEVPWTTVLSIIREFAPLQRSEGFQFRPIGLAKPRIEQFLREYKAVRASRGSLTAALSDDEMGQRLRDAAFTKRDLKTFQTRDLGRLLALSNGANFSVPGAGKTTVTFALHLLIKQSGHHLLVVAPKNAFVAWQDVVRDCIDERAPGGNAEPFTVLAGGGDVIAQLLESGATRFLITYDQLIRIPTIITAYFLRHPVHLVLDESHRMKAGFGSQRGSLLLGLSSLPVRRDILSGTPMPQSPSDLQSQLDFLWPGSGLGMRIAQGSAPRQVLGTSMLGQQKASSGYSNRIVNLSMSR